MKTIKEFIAAKGVTRCPPAFAAVTESAKPLSAEDRSALREHAKIMEGVKSSFGTISKPKNG